MLARFWYNVHLWLGLILGLYWVMLGLTGSLLVFGREIDHWLNPHLWNTRPAGPRKPVSEILASFRQQYPQAKYTYINYPFEERGSYYVRVGPNSAGQLDVHLHPETAEVLGARTRTSSFYGFLCYLHFYLFMGQIGWTVNGWGAALLLVLFLSGLWLWWPSKQASAAVWRSRFKINWRGRLARKLYDIHNVSGIYPLVFSLIFALTTLEFAFPDATKKFVYALTGDTPEPVFKVKPPSPEARPLPIDDLVAAADRAIDGRIRRVSFPRTANDALQVRKEWDDWNLTRNRAMIYVDPYTGRVLGIDDSRQTGLGRKIIQYCIPLHFGIWGGLATRVLYVILGLVPLVAFVTGFWHWRLRQR